MVAAAVQENYFVARTDIYVRWITQLELARDKNASIAFYLRDP